MSDHTHDAGDVQGVPTLAQVLNLSAKVEELSRRLDAERQVLAAVAEGSGTIERIAVAIERQAYAAAASEGAGVLSRNLLELVAEIRGTAP